MAVFQELRKEICEDAKGVFAPWYFRAAGYEKDLSATPPMLRANGVYALFAESTPVVLKNEWIAGNTRCLRTLADQEELERRKQLVKKLGSRNFWSNLDHYAPDYDRIMTLGLPGLRQLVAASLARHQDPQKQEMLRAMDLTLRGFERMIQNYGAAARQQLDAPDYDRRKLGFIAANCEAILAGPPQTFGQALQLTWFCHNAFVMEGRRAMALGRMDQYLYPFYRSDLEAGRLTREQAVELLENVFIKLPGDTVNICIGGRNMRGESQVNGLSYCILQAVGNCNVPGPNLSARISSATEDAFLDACLKTIGTGLGYPALMNDDVNIPALRKYGYAEEDVCDYAMVGCIENFIPGRQPPWTDGRFDTPRFLEYVFSRTDLGQLKTMDDFLNAYRRQLEKGAEEYYAWYKKVNDSIDQGAFPEPFLSCFCRDCIDRGMDINAGGSLYPSAHGAVLMGIGTVADSLAAVEKVVYRDKSATLGQLARALEQNFEGFETLHRQLLDAPKYGNNDDFADRYAVWFVDTLAQIFSKYQTRDGGPFYIAAAANIQNIYAGRQIGATPDGRKKGMPLSDAASPTYGMDVRGATAVVHSLTKPDYTKLACGTVVNQKFSPALFAEGRRGKLLALVKTYFKKGGQQLQINATSRETLLDAMEHPEKYPNLVVRVSGFSAFYVNLERDIQMDILNRTQQE